MNLLRRVRYTQPLCAFCGSLTCRQIDSFAATTLQQSLRMLGIYMAGLTMERGSAPADTLSRPTLRLSCNATDRTGWGVSFGSSIPCFRAVRFRLYFAVRWIRVPSSTNYFPGWLGSLTPPALRAAPFGHPCGRRSSTWRGSSPIQNPSPVLAVCPRCSRRPRQT